MCRYAMTKYKPHFACFSCQKSFKRRLLSDLKRGGEHRPYHCPQCGGEMADMGLDFAPPKMNNHKAWKTLKSLYEVGMTFHGCGCSGPGYRPRDPIALIKFLEKRLQQYEQHAMLLDSIPLLPPNQELSTEPKGRWRKPRWRLMEREEARSHWNQKITMLRAELKKYKR